MQTEKAVMAVFAHADDVELGCGGTLSKYREKSGYRVDYVMSTNNMSGSWCSLTPDGKLESRKCPWHEMMPQRKKEADVAAREFYGTEAVHLDHPQRHYQDDSLDRIELRYGNPPPAGIPANVPSILTAAEDRDATARLTALILERNPEVIFTHAAVDSNPEHTCTAWLVIRAFRAAAEQGFSGSLLLSAGRHSGEAAASYSRPDTCIDISGEWLKRKIDALAVHACQSAGIFAERICNNGYRPLGQPYGFEAAETFIIHRLAEDNAGELTQELIRNRALVK
ncbi:MAG: PIG-L family deacetylase [Lentisphaeria bacterium]|nr:PIG-L family deacetylase [Lentisphaeria bacterium]